jgi:hypothetical protein
VAELDSHSGIYFNEIISVLLVNQEFSSTSVAVVDGSSKFHSIVQNLVSHVLR